MSLFQNSVLNKYLKGLESEKVKEAYQRFTSHFHNPTIQENIRNSKEEQYQGEFLIDLFVNVLGYTKNPTPNFNLTTELKNIKDSKKTDGAILSGQKALAVIELKGTNTTDLSKVETQAFGYKNNQPGCVYVITSNFEKLRFYVDNAVEFEEFNLFQLTKERFDVLWLCLSSDYLLKNTPKKIKDESLTQEEKITKELYKDYASFRNEVFESIQKENPEYDKLTLFKKTQKLLDRFLFIFFAEDRLLLPPNSIRSIVNQWTDLRDKYDEYFTLYDRFQKYFGYMNTGHKGQQHDIFAYNGGLFAPDEILDKIKINDELLYKHTIKLSNYDFESEVSVNILGHIFEHSLNDIDEIQSEIQGVATEQSKTKRKKDGVFYTPKYITKYIVDNTVGKLCEAKKIELDIQEAEYEKERKGRKKVTLKNLTQKLEDYRKWLLQITICDPACGSGAFLNQALEFLITEHKYIDELQAKLFGDSMILSEVENSILENNLYGVDINEESVDIAKLSLWLRTAQKGRKLTSLNNNIKCGNSLIDDPNVAGDKAFNWQKEFPKVFKKGGFDVVIGNPPYVSYYGRFKNPMNKETEIYYKNKYDFIGAENRKIETKQIKGKFNTIMFFLELSSKIGTNISLIIDLNFSKLPYLDIRKYLADNCQIEEVILNITGWSDVGSGQILVTFTKNKNGSKTSLKKGFFAKESEKVDQKDIVDFFTTGSQTSSVVEKLASDKFNLLSHWYPKKLIRTSINFGAQKNSFLVDKDSSLAKPLAEGSDSISKRYFPPEIKTYINYDPSIIHKINHENDKESIIKKNKQGKVGGLGDDVVFCNPKLIIRQAGSKLCATYFESELYLDYSLFSISNKNSSIDNSKISLFLTLAIVNSKLLNYYAWEMNIIEHQKGGTPQMRIKGLRSLPVPKEVPKTIQQRLINLSMNLIEKAKDIDKINVKFNNFIYTKFKTSDKLDLLGKHNILAYLQLVKIKLSLSEESEWTQYYNEQKEKAITLQKEIDQTDREIDQMVYELYGLTEDEIKIVEEANA